MKNFINDGLSIDETKASVLIVSLAITLIFAMVMYCVRGMIGENLTTIILTLIAAIAGVNGLNAVGDMLNKAKG